MKKFIIIFIVVFCFLAFSQVQAAEINGDLVWNSNSATVTNNVETSLNTGGNTADGSYGGNSAGGNGGDAGVGGTVISGDATSITEVSNTVNSNKTLLVRPVRCCFASCSVNIDVVRNENSASIGNNAGTVTETGLNSALGSYAGSSGGSEIVSLNQPNGHEHGNHTSGNGGASSDGGLVQSGSALSSTSIVNIVNRNLTRIIR